VSSEEEHTLVLLPTTCVQSQPQMLARSGRVTRRSCGWDDWSGKWSQDTTGHTVSAYHKHAFASKCQSISNLQDSLI